MGYEAYRELRVRAPEAAGHRPRGRRAVADQPVRGDDEPRRQAVVGARPRAAVGLALRRRAAAVRAHGGGLRRLPQPRRPRARAAAGLPGGQPASSTTRSSSSSPTTAPPARAARTARSTRTSSSTASPTRSRRTSSTSTSSADRRTYNHYPTGWAWAFNTPFKMWKRYANYEGGTADPLIVSWPQRHRRGRRDPPPVLPRGRHRADAVRALGVELPDVVNGYTQKPLEGVSFTSQLRRRRRADRRSRPSSTRCSARGRSGTRAGRRRPRCPAAPDSWGDFHQQRWELFDTEADPSECHDLAEQHPEKLQELIALWWAEAGKYQALPLESRGAVEILTTERPQLSKPRTRYVYYPGGAEMPESVAPNIRNRSYTIAAEMEIETPEAGGVIFSQGSRFGGHALYVHGRQAQVRLQLDRRARADRRVRRDDPDRPRRPLGLVRARGRHDAHPGHAQPPHPRPEGRRGHDPDPARQVRPRRRRPRRRPLRRRAGHRRLRRRARRGRSSAARSSASSSTSAAKPFVDLAQKHARRSRASSPNRPPDSI